MCEQVKPEQGDAGLTVGDIEHVIENTFLERRMLIRTLYGQKAPMHAASMVIKGIMAFFFGLLTLGAFDVDLVALMIPMASLVRFFAPPPPPCAPLTCAARPSPARSSSPAPLPSRRSCPTLSSRCT